jgi:hydrogenase expression/formation protein HypE
MKNEGSAEERILLAHGSGGAMSHELISSLFVRAFQNPVLERLDDLAVVVIGGINLAFTTDSYVVSPIFFPGGDIGKLAVCGTINDLAMGGARPLYLSAGFILEEGFPVRHLEAVVASMRESAFQAGVQIVTGDTKVVNRGAADGIFINTAGLGYIEAGTDISGRNARPGDKVLVSGTVGDHGIAILSRRSGLEFSTRLVSDCAPLHDLVARMLAAAPGIRCLRDPTRGGLSTALNELARQSKTAIRIEETRIPVREEVRGACELLGLDPFTLANEGKLLAVVAPAEAEKTLAAMKAHPLGREAALIGEVLDQPAGKVLFRTPLGTTRIQGMLVGEPLPRIC